MIQIKEETLNIIINYLVYQPYKDVYNIIQMIQNDIQENNKKDDTIEEEKKVV